MRTIFLGLGLALLAQAAMAETTLSAAERAAAFRAAGFHLVKGAWHKCDDPGEASYSPGSIEQAGDFNGDGRPDAVITESSSYCFGNTGTAFALVSRQPDGSWRLLAEDTGVLTFLKTKGAAGWPDIEVGGPGFCFPVQRWNGKAYALQRHEYEGKPCRP